jgi:acetyltransferase-like isoleucine patch superfamily enzyme
MSSNQFFIHPSAIVDTLDIGQNSRIWAFTHVLKGAKIGRNANICDHCYIENQVAIGNDVTIKCGVWVWDGVTIEDNVFIGPSVTFTNDLYPRSKNTQYEQNHTTLREGCSIGANATVLAGITIGRYAMVGAGAVVTKDVGDFELVYGNPAKQSGYVCRCGQKLSILDDAAQCDCGASYIYADQTLKLI